MNGTDDQDSSWDSLAADLGLEPAPAPKSKPAPAAKPKPAPEPEPEPEPESAEDEFVSFDEDKPADEAVAPRLFEPEAAAEVNVEETIVDDSFGVLDDESPVSEEATGEDEVPADGATSEGTGGKRRRRRRRRRKGGGASADPQATAEPAAIEEAAEASEADRDDEDLTDVIGDAAPELDDDSDDDELTPAAIEEEEDDSTEPLPDKQVVAWTDLIATLYRPQDR